MTVPNTTPNQTPGPYAHAAERYFRAGWSPLPLPHGKKGPVPTGWTGRDGAWPSYPDVHAWLEERGSGNVALRLPPTVIGVDCDHYGNKPGGMVLANLETQLGALPPTWRSTSRDDGTSGIRLYRIPEGHRWPGVLGPGIEVIRHSHRYTVAWPSIHPDTGGTYRWITPAGAVALDAIPTPDELPALPAAWIDHFALGEETDQARAGLDATTGGAWMTERGAGAPCLRITDAVTTAQADLRSGTSRHDAALTATNRLVWLAGQGHPGATTALQQLGAAFLAATGTDRGQGEAQGEWDRMVLGAVDLAAAQHPRPAADPCLDPFAGLIPKDTTWTAPDSPSQASSPAPSTHSNEPSAPSSGTNGSTASAAATATAVAAPTPTTTTPPAATAPTPGDPGASTTADGLDPERLHQYYLEELARITGRQAAQAHYEDTHRDQVIADRVRRRVLDDDAKLEHRRLTEPPAPPFDAGTLTEILARPADPPMRFAGLIPWEASTLVVAMRKTGKTTLLLNYARAIITGEPLLGEFTGIPLADDERVAFLNYEVSGAMLGRWARDVDVPADRLYLVNLRGRRNPLSHPEDRAELVAQLRAQNVKAVIVDPFGRAYTGESQNDNGEVQAFLVDLDMFVRAEVGATDLVLATHAGWDGERSRGASALEDWGDTIITLTRDKDDDSKRFMKATGRDVDIEEDEVSMDPDTRILSRSGNGPRDPRRRTKDAKIETLALGTIRAINAHPGCSRADVKRAVAAMDDMPSAKGGRGEELLTSALKHAERCGSIRVERAERGNASAYFSTGNVDNHSHHSRSTPGDRLSTTTPHSPTYREGSGGGAVGSGGPLPNDGSTSKLLLEDVEDVDDEGPVRVDRTTGEVLS